VNYRRESLLASAIAVLAISATSATALPMAGMEHTVHFWVTVVTFWGLAENEDC
jgi:hypothetical protein